VSLAIVTPPPPPHVGFVHGIGTARLHPAGGSDGTPGVLTVRQVGSASGESISVLARMPFPP
jgi:hypothetical protein